MTDLTPEAMGAAGDGATNDTIAIVAWLKAADLHGRTAEAPLAKTYLVDQVRLTLSKPLSVEMHPGAVIKGAPGIPRPVIEINGGPERSRLVWRGGAFDCSERAYVTAAGSGSALGLHGCDHFLIDGVRFSAGTEWEAGVGDSGIVPISCVGGRVVNCHFHGWPDLGIYVSGGASEEAGDDCGDTVIANNTFVKCRTGITAKRSSRRLIVTGNHFSQCAVGVSLYDIPRLGAGREFLVSGNVFHKTSTRAIVARLSRGDVITGNQIVDWGCTSDGERNGIQAAIQLAGVQQAIVTGNQMRLDEWPNVGQRGVELRDYTFDGVTTPATDNLINNNIIAGVELGLVETGSATANGMSGNKMLGVTRAARLARNSTSVA